MAGREEEMDLVQDTLTKLFSRWTFIGELDLEKMSAKAEPAGAGERVNWLKAPEEPSKLYHRDCLFICNLWTVLSDNENDLLEEK